MREILETIHKKKLHFSITRSFRISNRSLFPKSRK